MKKIQWTITIAAILLIFVHHLIPKIDIDAITITLITLAALPWLAPLFKAIELPGGIKVEFNDLQRVKDAASEAGLLAPPEDVGHKKPFCYSFEIITADDPNLALTGVRLEIESRVRELAESKNITGDKVPLEKLIRKLSEVDVLTNKEVSVLNDLLPLLNQAAHGAKVDSRAIDWARDIGSRIIRTLDEKKGESSLPALLQKWQHRDGAAVAEVGTELSRSLITTPESFLSLMHENPNDLDSWLDNIEHNTFTVFEARDDLDNELYIAYYSRMKELMLQSVEPYLNTKFAEEAKKIKKKLSDIEISVIW